MRSRPLLIQVLAINLLLIAAAALIGALAVGWHVGNILDSREAAVLGLALLAALLGNWLLLHRRFRPLDELISTMERIDLARPAPEHQTAAQRADSAEAVRLRAAFDRMVARIQDERLQAGRAVIRAQERERRRLARDLHDEVNQALTAVTLRLQASIEQAPPNLRRELTETKRLAGTAMEELLALARQLRPAVLDDHGLLPALHSQVQDFAEQTRIDASFRVRGTVRPLSPEQQLVIYRVTQETLSNVAQHAGAAHVRVELSFVGATLLSIVDDGSGFATATPAGRGGLGLSGMRERALLVGGHLRIISSPGRGTRVELMVRR